MILVVSHKGESALEHHLDCCGAGRGRPRLLRSFLVASLDQEAIHDPILRPYRFAHPRHCVRIQDFGRPSKRHRTPLWPTPNVARLNRHSRVFQDALDLPRIGVRREGVSVFKWNYPNCSWNRRSILSKRNEGDVPGVVKVGSHSEKYAVDVHRNLLIVHLVDRKKPIPFAP